MKNFTSGLALLGCIASAHAQTLFYGTLQMSVDYGSNSAVHPALSLQDTGSVLGFKGRDELDGPAYLAWQIEQNIDGTDGRNVNWGAQEAWVGIGLLGLGQLRAGISRSSYSLVVTQLDFFQSNTTLLNTFMDGAYKLRYPGSVFFASERNGGVLLKIEAQPNNPQLAHSGGITLDYEHNAFKSYLAWQYSRNSARDLANTDNPQTRITEPGKSIDSLMTGARYRFNSGLLLAGLLQYSSQDLASTQQHLNRTGLLLDAQWRFTHWVPRLGLVHQFTGHFNAGPDAGTATQLELGTDYLLSAHTLVYMEAAVLHGGAGDHFYTSSADRPADSAGHTGRVISMGLISRF